MKPQSPELLQSWRDHIQGEGGLHSGPYERCPSPGCGGDTPLGRILTPGKGLTEREVAIHRLSNLMDELQGLRNDQNRLSMRLHQCTTAVRSILEVMA